MTQNHFSFQGSDRKIVLHCCCAPCSGSIIERFLLEKTHFEIFFYNPNIHPEEEYLRRKDEILNYAQRMRIPFVDADYDSQNWFAYVKGHGSDPERGARCSLCFQYRLLKTAEHAQSHGFSFIATTLGISRKKDFDQVTDAGLWAASQFSRVTYIALNWRKNGGVQRMDEIAKQERFYRQNYCGCIYSLKTAKERYRQIAEQKVSIK